MKTNIENLSPNWFKFLNISSFTLSGIGLLADILGIGKLAFDVVITGNLTDLGFRLLILTVVFFFGIGLGVVAMKGFENTRVVDMAIFFSWVYIAIACLSYLGIALSLKNQDYTILTYFSFVVIIGSQLLAAKGIQIALEDDLDIRQFSIPILTICLIHAILIVYSYIFIATPVTFFLAGDLIFFTGMTLVGSAMLGDIAFISLMRKIYEEVTGS